MPNWCYNNAKITHENPAKIAELKGTFETRTTFEHFIPLPEGKWDWDFCVNNWGTKWDIGHPSINDSGPNMLDIYFETAWSPPTGVFEAMKAQGYVIEAEYWEEGGFFVGRWIDGEGECYEPENAPEELYHLARNTYFDDEEAA